MQSQEFFGADSQIHASIMRHLERDRFEVHCAVPIDEGLSPCQATTEVRQIPDLKLRPTNFGRSLASGGSRARRLIGLIRRVLPTCWSLLGLVRYVRRHHIQVIHCTEKPRDALYGSVIARLGGARCVIHVHVKAEEWIRASVRSSMHRAAALIGVSEFVAGSLRDLGYEPSKVVAVLNGLEVDEWNSSAVDIEAVRGEFNVPAGGLMIVSASRLFRFKGQHELLAALPQLKDRFPNLKVLIVGQDDPRGYAGDKSYSEVLKEMCVELSLEDEVVFTGWRSDVPALMAACDVYAMPSFEEPFGMVFTEAMFMRRPIVALDNGGTREVVDHGGSGLLSAPGDVDAITSNLETLLGDAELRKRMGEHGRQRVLDHFNSVRMTREVEQVYEWVTG